MVACFLFRRKIDGGCGLVVGTVKMENYQPGDFRFHPNADILADAYQAVTEADAWDFLCSNNPPAEKGFMFWSSPELTAIQKKMELGHSHSGASWAFVMRSMQAIAQKGWAVYVDECLHQM